MIFKVFDRTSIRVGEETYKYTIDVMDDIYGYKLGLTEVATMRNTSIRDSLDFLENCGAFVSNQGKCYFNSKDQAQELISLLTS